MELIDPHGTALGTHPCVDCGEADPIVLDFDHVRGEKADNIGTMLGSTESLAKVQAEAEKCDIRCANCHRRATHARRAS